jgi:predicted anti-sigma-YlaC factor YlaD
LETSRNKRTCSDCEQRILGADSGGDAPADSGVSDHIAACADCRALYESLAEIKPVLDRYRVGEPAEALLQKVVGRALQVQSARPTPATVPARAGVFRLLLAGLVSLPLVVLINALIGWALYEAAISLLPRTIALYCGGLFAVWASMAVSLGYASLPLMNAIVSRPSDRPDGTDRP